MLMSKPVLLDLFCCAGGAGMGYHRAGFDVVGVDIKPQPHYPFPFVQMDALEVLRILIAGGYITDNHGRDRYLRDFAAIHASPPCQLYCALKSMPNFNADNHDDLIEPTRTALMASGLPWVMENVPGAPLINPVMLCGTMFGLQTDCGATLRRHRNFETNWCFMSGLVCNHGSRSRGSISATGTGNALGGRSISVCGKTAWAGSATGKIVGAQERPRVISVHGTHARDPYLTKNRVITIAGHAAENRATCGGRERVISVTGNTPQMNVVRNQVRETFTVKEAQTAMGIDWCGMKGLSQAIPPAYTEYIGKQLIRVAAKEES